MTTLRQAAQAVLERWDSPSWQWSEKSPTADLMAALRTALEQQAEPVAWVCMNGEKHDIDFDQPEIDAIPVGTFLYTAPPAAQPEQVDCPRCGHVCSQRPWVGLTPEEVLDLFDINNVYGSKWIEFARTVENKLKEKNRAN